MRIRDLGTCCHCGTKLTVGDNWTEASARHRDYTCRSCKASHWKGWRKQNRNQVQLQIAIQQVNREIDPIVRMQHQFNNRKSLLKMRYGITKEEYLRIAQRQHFRCAICQIVPRKSLTVDHDHKTGRVRGLLCRYCNVVVAIVENKPTLLEKAKRYVTEQARQEILVLSQ